MSKNGRTPESLFDRNSALSLDRGLAALERHTVEQVRSIRPAGGWLTPHRREPALMPSGVVSLFTPLQVQIMIAAERERAETTHAAMLAALVQLADRAERPNEAASLAVAIDNARKVLSDDREADIAARLRASR